MSSIMPFFDFHPETSTKISTAEHATRGAILAAGILGLAAVDAGAAPILIPNHSFETPDVTFAGAFDSNPATPWQITQTTESQVGAFDNTPPDSPAGDHIDNVSGNQVAFMFVGPGITLFQELASPEGVFTAGEAYTFTIGAGGSAGLPNDAKLQLRLYYLDGTSKITVAMATFDFDPALDPGPINHLYDYSVTSDFVEATDAWAGKAIGIEIATPGTPAFGYWDLDNARLNSVPEPGSAALLMAAIGALGLHRARRQR